MMRKILLFVLPIALAACATGPQEVAPGAATVKAERPETKVGDTWTSACTEGRQKYDFVRVITSVDQTGIKGTVNGQRLLLTVDLNEIETPWGKSANPKGLSFPLEVGKQWNYSDEWVNYRPPIGIARGTAKVSVTVVGYEKVRVRAGEFDAFKLKSKYTWIDAANSSIGTSDNTYWYAPAAHAVVKYDAFATNNPDTTCELVEFQLQP